MSFLPLPKPALALFKKELRELLAARSLWVMLLLLSPLVGYSFIQAVDLYSQASQTALQFPELAKGLTPLDGILVPTFGALYLVMTLLFPFVAIRLLGHEKQSGSLKLLLQLPIPTVGVVFIKVLAITIGWLLTLIPVFSALIIWLSMGGHLNGLELLNLLMGHALYGLVITSIAFLSATMTGSPATAAIVALAFTIGSWVLDFAAGTTGWLRFLSFLSLTATLREFERGLLASPQVIQFTLMAVGLLLLTAVWLPTGLQLRLKAKQSGIIMLLLVAFFWASIQSSLYLDVSENRRNSFNPADEVALHQMRQPLHITIYLSPDDSRLKEMESNVLDKLRRSVPHLTITYADTHQAGLFGAGTDDKYGLIVYEYGDKRDESRSNSEKEILPILHHLAGQQVQMQAAPPYPGYPLVAKANQTQWWFYGGLPFLIGVGWWLSQHPRKRIKN